MQLEDYFDFVAPEQIEIKGHRILIDDLLHEYIHNAMTPDELAERFPTLTLEEIYATLLYYVRNKADIDRYLTANIEYSHQRWLEQQQHPTPGMVRLRELRAKRQAQGIQDQSPVTDEQVPA